jgi:hypothetical protein
MGKIKILLACIGICSGLLGTHPATAQDTHKDSLVTAAPAGIRLSPEQLKPLEGYYRSSQNKDMVVQISAAENGLSAKLLWNNGEMHLAPESELAFVSRESGDEGPIHLLFQRDSSGAVNQINVANLGTWNRAKDYKPLVQKEMEHSPAQLTPFQGSYQLREDPTRFIQFSVRENKLVLKQIWDGEEILFVPESELSFFSRAIPSFSLDFSKDKDGNITQVVAFKRDVWIKKGKPALSPAMLKTYEGKYRSQNDTDNEIRIAATDTNLIVTQLWDKKDYVLQSLTDIYFNNQSRSFPLVIVKDPDNGKVVQVVLMTGNIFDRVQEQPRDTAAPVEIRLSPEQLKAYEGYYQLSGNENVKVRLVLVENYLHLKPIWNEVDIRLVPVSDSVFSSGNGENGKPQYLKFVKDAHGVIQRFTGGGGEENYFNRLKDYKPVEKKEIAHTPKDLKAFEGVYQSRRDSDDIVGLSERDNKLVMKQYWNGEDVLFVPDSALHFFSREQRLLNLKFNRGADGSIRSVEAFNKEEFDKVKKPRVSLASMKPFGGSYRLKADSDDVIHVTATDSGLVIRQLWDGKEIVVRPLTKSYFYSKIHAYTLYFRKDKDGAVVAAVALDADEFEKVKE